MSDKFLKIYNSINWPIIFFSIFLTVFLFDFDVRFALALYALIVLLDIIVMTIQKQTRQLIYNIIAVIGLIGLLLFLK